MKTASQSDHSSGRDSKFKISESPVLNTVLSQVRWNTQFNDQSYVARSGFRCTVAGNKDNRCRRHWLFLLPASMQRRQFVI